MPGTDGSAQLLLSQPQTLGSNHVQCSPRVAADTWTSNHVCWTHHLSRNHENVIFAFRELMFSLVHFTLVLPGTRDTNRRRQWRVLGAPCSTFPIRPLRCILQMARPWSIRLLHLCSPLLGSSLVRVSNLRIPCTSIDGFDQAIFFLYWICICRSFWSSHLNFFCCTQRFYEHTLIIGEVPIIGTDLMLFNFIWGVTRTFRFGRSEIRLSLPTVVEPVAVVARKSLPQPPVTASGPLYTLQQDSFFYPGAQHVQVIGAPHGNHQFVPSISTASEYPGTVQFLMSTTLFVWWIGFFLGLRVRRWSTSFVRPFCTNHGPRLSYHCCTNVQSFFE
jgi:hypothetical protein